ncbi:hypothetical protein ACI2L1_39160 [Streptomyces sp. NPDC019531]|uniref:hypothetical protein n=1 Tax=Streptomyces sp. NPDC019531 TaxID=3365062 RepID=UPI00384BDA60
MAMNMKLDLEPRAPYPLGYAEAATSSQTVTAPLLTGAALALVGVILVEGEEHFRWPDVTLLLVVGASIALITSIQIGADARKYLYNRETIEAWHGKDEDITLTRDWTEHTTHFNTWKERIYLAVIAFNLGTLLLVLALSAALLPQDNHAVLRWISAGLALAGALVEAWWIYHLFHKKPRKAEKKPASPGGGKI